MKSTWRNAARARIAGIKADIGTDDEQAFRTACRIAYPWGPRQYWPYKVWCQEINIALGKPVRKTKQAQADRALAKEAGAIEAEAAAAGQESFFDLLEQ